MPFKYRALTANCGNDTLGEVASEHIAKMLLQDDADFFVINCQEVDFNKAQQQLQRAIAAVDGKYEVVCCAQMATHTKLATQFNSNTGIATFIIHKKELHLDIQTSFAARRNEQRLGGGSGYNKGGLITDLLLSKGNDGNHQEKLKIQAISGHLESNKYQKRSVEWHNINQELATDGVSNWNQLVAVCPHLRLSGYDANTRNKLSGGKSVNLWDSPNTPEVQALYQASLATQHFSCSSTYKTDVPDVTTIADPKRPGYSFGGMLDFVGIADGSIGAKAAYTEKNIIQIAPEKGTERDHDILASPWQEYAPLATFDLVKGQLASRLERAAPTLAKELRELEDNENNRNKLIAVFNQILKPDAALNTMLTLHAEKLACFNHLMKQSFLKDEALQNKLTETLFPESPWFASLSMNNMTQELENYAQKMLLAQLIIASLNHCSNKIDVEKQLNTYKELMAQINGDNYDAPYTTSKESRQVLTEFLIHYEQLNRTISEYKPQTENELAFQHSGQKILAQIKTLSCHEMTGKKPDLAVFSQLIQVLGQCQNGFNALKNGGDVRPYTQELTNLAQSVSGKASPAWQKLGTELLTFACIALVLGGLLAAIPSGGASLFAVAAGLALATGMAGVGLLAQGREKGLAKSISTYKTAIDSIKDDNEDPLCDSEEPSINHL